MVSPSATKLSELGRELPEGARQTSGWLTGQGYPSSLRSRYVADGWLDKPARGVFRWPGSGLQWEQVVVSLQTLLRFPVVVGGRTALNLLDYVRFLPGNRQEVHLYGRVPLPGWTEELPVEERFVFHDSERLFPDDRDSRGLADLDLDAQAERDKDADPFRADFVTLPWGQWNWPLVVSRRERALLELIDELPRRESFRVVDECVRELPNLDPEPLQKLLGECRSVKVKRLFFFFADRHKHAYLEDLDRDGIDFGTGPRMLVRGGRFDPVHRITVPEDLDGV